MLNTNLLCPDCGRDFSQDWLDPDVAPGGPCPARECPSNLRLDDTPTSHSAKLLDQIQDMLSMALQGDLEHGVAWLNDEAAREFNEKYPDLSKTIGEIMDMEFDE